MFSVSDLSEEQIEAVKVWVAEGAQMADVQKRLNEDFGFKVTYMDTRFLSLDLELEFEAKEEEVKAELEATPTEEPPVTDDAPVTEVPLPTEGGVSATLDQIARPGAMVSGTVTFSDGMKGVWMIDEMGRPSVDPDQAGYQPTEVDLISFQEKLRGMLDGHM